VAAVTRSAVEQMALTEDAPVVAIIKATEVLIGKN